MNRVKRLAFLIFLLGSYPLDAFNPNGFGASSPQCNPTSSSLQSLPSRVAGNSNPKVDDSFSSDDAGRQSQIPVIVHKIHGSTPGSLTGDLLDKDKITPLLLNWAKTESVEGAKQIEKLLRRLEEEAETGNKMVKLNSKYYTIAVDAWAKSGHDDAASYASKILEKMVANGKSDPSVAPTRVTYNTVMHAHSKKGDTERTAKLLEFMENSSSLTPITNDYNVLLGAHAKLGEARKSEGILKTMVDRCNTLGKECECAPDLYSYNMLLDAWGKSNEQGRGMRAEEILGMLESKFEIGEFLWQPDARTYSAAICAVVHSQEDNSTERAENLLAQSKSRGIPPDAYLQSALLDAYARSAAPGSAEKAELLLNKLEKEGIANAVSYNTVLKAWKSSQDIGAPSRAEAIMDRMEQGGLADTISYSTLIAIYADKGNHASAERADEIVKTMHEAGSTPNTQTLNAVMNAWVRCGEIHRAERIIEQMEQSFYDGSRKVRPNVISYTTIMNGWAKSKDAAAVEKTEANFNRMKSMYESGNVEARPNLFSFVTLINSITRSGAPGAAEKAEKIILGMYGDYKQGNTNVKPNTQLVTSVIDCWQKSGEREAGERAEGLLNWMIDVYEQDGDRTLQPNEYSFNAAISAWAKTRKFGKALRARAILSRMMDLHKRGIIEAPPNSYCYTAVINSCAYCENDALEKRDAINIAVKTYKELTGSAHLKPNQVTFSTMFTALRNLMPPSEKRAAAVHTIFNKCADEGEVAEFVLRRLQSLLNTEQLRELVGENAVSADGTVNIDLIPNEWKRNTQNQRPTRKDQGERRLVTQAP